MLEIQGTYRRIENSEKNFIGIYLERVDYIVNLGGEM